MKVKELLDTLQALLDSEEVTEDTVVNVIHQPNYPLRVNIHGLVSKQMLVDYKVQKTMEEYQQEALDEDGTYPSDASISECEENARVHHGDNCLDELVIVCGSGDYKSPYGEKDHYEVLGERPY